MKVPERQTISDKDVSGLLSKLIALNKDDLYARLPIERSGVIELSEPTAQLARLRQVAGKARLRQVAGKQRKFERRASLGEVRGFRKAVDRDQLSSDLRGWLQR